MTDSNDESPSARRMQHLRELGRGNQLERVDTRRAPGLGTAGRATADPILLRPDFLQAAEADGRAAPMSHLIACRGVALRFYLLAVSTRSAARHPVSRRGIPGL